MTTKGAPTLQVRGPHGQSFAVELLKDRVTIGRFPMFNDIALEPDPQQLVTRKVHCSVERSTDSWCVVDNGSVNKTFLRRGQAVKIVEGQDTLTDGDVICILGRLTDGGEAVYWELTFKDPLGTRPVEGVQRVAYLVYDWTQARLFRIDGPSRQEIRGLRPQEHKLIRYMDQRNRANGNVSVMCTYDELIAAVWGEEAFHRTEADINHLIWELRKKLETDPNRPRFIHTIRGLGYRLETRSLTT